MPTKALSAYQAERDALLERIKKALLSDPRIVAAWVGGSVGAGTADELSDLDVWVVVEDSACEAVYEERTAFVNSVGRAVLHLVAPQNAPTGGAYLLVLYAGTSGSLQVDWYWQPCKATQLPHDAGLLFDRVGLPSQLGVPLPESEVGTLLSHKLSFFWAMMSIIPKKIIRDEHWTVIAMLRMLDGTLEETKALLGLGPFPTYKSQPAYPIPADPAAQMAMLHALGAAMEALSPLLEMQGVDVLSPAVEAVKGLIGLAEGAMG